MSRKTYYLPHHIKDRIQKYRNQHDQIDENEAVIRLLDLGLKDVERSCNGQPKIVDFKIVDYWGA